MTAFFSKALVDVEAGQVVEVCRAAGYGAQLTALIEGAHRAHPGTLGLVLAAGGDVADYVQAKAEVLAALNGRPFPPRQPTGLS